MDKTITIGTDVAHLVLFHPDDLEHRAHDPIAWYGYDFAYRHESTAGQLIGWGTGSDGEYRVRLTTGALTADEEGRACASWPFPLIVRHGRVLIDNTDALPGKEQMVQPGELADGWLDLPNGRYRVTVHPIDRSPAGAGGLPDYVVTFAPVTNLAGIAVADTPPELRPVKAWVPRQPPSMEGEARFLWRDAPLEREGFAALLVLPDIAILPGLSASFPVAEDVADLVFPARRQDEREAGLVLATTWEPGALALVARTTGRSWLRGRGTALKVAGRTVVRLLEIGPVSNLRQVRVAPLGPPDMAVDAATFADFRSRLLTAAGPLAISRFEAERLETLSCAETVTGWALMQLALPLETRLALWASSARERMAGIGKLLPQVD